MIAVVTKPIRHCAAGDCQKAYKAVRDNQLYCSKRCKNRMAAKRYYKVHGPHGYLEAAYRERDAQLSR